MLLSMHTSLSLKHRSVIDKSNYDSDRFLIYHD